MVQQCLKEHGNNFVAIDGEIKVNNWVQHNKGNHPHGPTSIWWDVCMSYKLSGNGFVTNKNQQEPRKYKHMPWYLST